MSKQLTLIVLMSITFGIGNAKDMCHLFSNGTVIRDPFICTQYIECIDFKSNYKYCTTAKPYYSIAKKQCVAELDNYDTCYESSCKDAVNDFIADPFTCTNYFYCLDEQTPLRAECPNDMHFDAATKTCIYENVSKCNPTEVANAIDYCSIVPAKVNFAIPETTNQYYSCNATGTLVTSKCVSTDYLRITGKCGTDICGTHDKPKVNFVVDPDSCVSYYKCNKMSSGRDENPIQYKCPADTFFSETDQACVEPSQVHCTANRCEGRSQSFVLSSTYGCRNYFLCTNGVSSTEYSCGNAFFNEKYAVCNAQIESYGACTVKPK